jgi:hypothetical protein
MQHIYDNLVIALGIVASLGCVLACFYFVYHSAMIAVCRWRDTPPDQRALWEPDQRTLRGILRILPSTAKLHLRKALKGLLAFFGFFLLVVVVGRYLP